MVMHKQALLKRKWVRAVGNRLFFLVACFMIIPCWGILHAFEVFFGGNRRD
jgi:hypothetical protein